MPVAITLGVIGLCFVIGWAVTYGSRSYLGLLGLGFMAAGGAAFLHPGAARYALAGASMLFFVLALITMFVHIGRRTAQLREESLAREQAFFEMLQAADNKQRSQAESPQQAPADESAQSAADDEGESS